MAMTEKQKLFAETYLANGFNALDAYYEVFGKEETKNKPSYPYKLLKNKDIAEYLEKRRNEIYESLNIDAIRKSLILRLSLKLIRMQHQN